MVRLDLNAMLQELERTWSELARDKWKLGVRLDLYAPAGQATPLLIQGDASHLQQAFENLLFNSRDATFEMRNHLREQARHGPAAPGGPLTPDRRQALIAAAGWKGEVTLRSRRVAREAVLEVEDNGIGMTEEVRRRCLDPHFSTKRDNALFAGLTAGMGLGLSFVQVILEHHNAKIEIDSTPLGGAVFRLRFPLEE
jgi:signal transduction histidine kinase